MNRHERRRELKGFDRVPASGKVYSETEEGPERDLMAAILRAADPYPDGFSDEWVFNNTYSAINRGQLDVWIRWSADGIEVKAVRPSGGVATPVMSRFVSFENLSAPQQAVH